MDASWNRDGGRRDRMGGIFPSRNRRHRQDRPRCTATGATGELRRIAEGLLRSALTIWLRFPQRLRFCCPFLLNAFHAIVGTQAVSPPPLAIAEATFILFVAFGVPFLGIALACRPTSNPGSRRLAYASVAAPTLYVFLGVVQILIKSPIPDEVVWCAIWLAIAPTLRPAAVSADVQSLSCLSTGPGTVVAIARSPASHRSTVFGDSAQASFRWGM